VTKKEVANDTKLPPSLSVKENMPESIKNTKISDSSTKDEDTDYQSPFQAKVEMYKEFLEEGTRLLKNGDYDGAMRAFDQSSETAPPWMLKKIDRLRFSAYFKKNQPMLEYGGYTVMAVLLILLLWLLGIFRKKGHYDLVSPKKTLAKAARYIEKEKWENAILEYSKIPESTLTREEAIKASLDMALAYMARNSNSNAILHARKVLKRDPGNVDAHLILGKVYIKLKDHTLRAMEIFEFLADRNLANLVMLKALAAYFLKQNQISEKASRIATDIQRYDPDDLTSSQLLARCYHSNNRIDDEALGFMKRITQLLPREVTIKLYLLEIYFRRKNYKEVVREAIGIFPLNVDNIVVHSLFIDSIVRLKQPKMLLTEYNRLSLEYPGSVIVKYLYQSFHSLLVRNRQYPETDISLSLKVNFTVCPRCFHLNLTEFNHCQKCKAQLNP
jgi:tetratricopeptide (TPR) repeat protein